MKRTFLSRILLSLTIAGTTSMVASAQGTPPAHSGNSTYPEVLPGFYIGARGGYLLKDNKASENPALYLNNGYFGEINAGWRARNNWFGWNLSIGRLNIERTLPKSIGQGFELNGYDVLKSASPDNWIWDSITQDNRKFLFDKNSVAKIEKKNMQSWYAMTGPEFWYGKGRLQGFLSLNAGVGMTKAGYYFLNGSGMSTNALLYSYASKDNGQVAGDVNTSAWSNYSQFGMSKKTFASYPPSSTSPLKEVSEINLMARASVGLEYFITSKISADISASYWYITMPEWESATEAKGELVFAGKWSNPSITPGPNDLPYVSSGAIAGSQGYSLKQNYTSEAPRMISANIGIKYWMGKKKEPKPVAKVEIPEVTAPATAQPQVQKKNLLVTVTDKPTGLSLSGVKVDVYKNGDLYFTALTDVNGALKQIDNLEAGNYEIRGMLNNIETTVARLDSSDFRNDARIISRELTHNDLRFTLVGHTLNAANDNKLPHIRTTLTEEGGGENSAQVSNDGGEFRFQLAPQSNFNVVADQKGYFSNQEHISTKGLDRSKTLYVDLRLAVNELTAGTHFELKDIYYDFNQSSIRPNAAVVLNTVYKMMVDNPSLVIELSSHTDSRGSDSYNLRLSQQRANAAVAYLVKKGITASRLIARGYGETQLVNGCANGVPCTEEQHQANRRTEIKIVKE